MNELSVTKLQTIEINEIADLLTHAFKTNPAYSLIFENKIQLEEGLNWLFKANLLMLNQKQVFTNVVKEKDTGKIIGTFTVLPPRMDKTKLSTYLKIRIPRFISTFGIKPLIRMLSLDSYNKKLLTNSIKSSEYYYLHMVVIDEKHRGCGIGSYVLRNAIQELIASERTCNKLGLTTQLPENVTFYSRLGFKKLDEGYSNFKGDSYYNSNMMLNL